MRTDVGSRKNSTQPTSPSLSWRRSSLVGWVERGSRVATISDSRTRDPTAMNADRCWVSQELDPTYEPLTQLAAKQSRRLGRARLACRHGLGHTYARPNSDECGPMLGLARARPNLRAPH